MDPRRHLRGVPRHSGGLALWHRRNRAIDRLRARVRGARTLEGVEAPPPPETPEALASTSETKA